MAFSTFFLLPKYLKLALAASDVQIGAVGAVGSIAGVLAFPLVGTLNDRFGRKPFMLLGSVLITLLSLSMLVIARVATPLYLTRLAHGLSFALFYNSATTLASDRVRPERLGVALGVFGSSVLITNALAPALAEQLAHAFDWPLVFWVAAGFGLLSAVLTLFVREAPREPHAVVGASGFALLRKPRARTVALAIAGAGAGFGTVFTFHQPYALQLGIEQVSSFFVAYACTALFGRMLLLKRIDAFDRQRVSALSTALYALAVFATAWLSPSMLALIGGVLGAAHGILYPVFNALALQGVPANERGSLMALYHGGFNGGMAVALLVGGAVAQALSFPWLFWLTGSVTFAAALLLWRSPLLRDERKPARVR